MGPYSILPLPSNPLDIGPCKNLFEAEKRSGLEPIKKKEPVSLKLIKSIFNKNAHDTPTLKDLRFADMCVLSFVGFFRANEFRNNRLCNITVFSVYITIRLPESKRDVYREGQDAFIHKSGNFTCPLSVVVKIFRWC